MSALCSFRDELRVAAGRGYVYKVTDTYVKVRRWSWKGYFSTMSNWRVRCIGLRVKKRITVDARRRERSDEVYEARKIKRNDVFGDAAASISSTGN